MLPIIVTILFCIIDVIVCLCLLVLLMASMANGSPSQLAQIKASSPDRTHVHVLQQAETYAAVANRYYEKPDDWRAIAAENRIDDPRRTTPGQFLRVPPLR